MPVTFGAPQFFILIPLLVVLAWYFRGLELWKPLRVVILVLIVLLLADPSVMRKQPGMDLWVLIDRSLSARDVVDRDAEEWKSLLERSRPGRHDQIHLVDYADEVVAKPGSETAIYPGNRSLTRTGLAIQDVLARVDKDRHSRLLLFSDGYSTEPLTGIAEKLVSMEVPLDFRQLRAEQVIDFRLAEFDLPGRVQIGEPYILEFTIAGNAAAEVPLEIYRGENKLIETKVKVEGGVGRIRLTDRIVKPGAHRYQARISPDEDAFEGNNTFEKWIEIVAGPRILLITNYNSDPMVPILRSQGFDVEVITDSLSLSPGMLTGARSVILNNVPAYEIPNDFLAALDFFVREQGGGFLMAGGKYSFGSGGYFESAVDSLLPVSMELKSEHRKLAVAMAIVMDRSGSMAMTTKSGNTKIQLANEGSARAVELLGGSDAVTVFAVDSQAHEIAPLLNVGAFRDELISRIRSIESMGGGIFVYTGLKEAWESLKKSELGQRHVILFSDAADSEEPGNYKSLIAEMRKEKATISVIGLGTRSDPDAAFLEDIAKRGGGRMFFTTVPGDLPNIFAQETVTVARSTFIDSAVATQATGNWYEVSNKDMPWLNEVDGYNLSYIRDEDQAALITTDEYKAPLVAFGRRGIGRSAAVSFPLGGNFSTKSREWEKAGDFMQTLNRWLMGEEIPPGIGLRHEIKGTELSIDLLFSAEEWKDKFALNPPKLKLSRGVDTPVTSELTWERIAPGRFSVKTDLREGELIRGAVQAGRSAIPFGPVIVGSSREWAFDAERVDEMRETSATSGGRELVDLADAWLKPEGREMSTIRAWLLVPLLGFFLLEALMTRTGWKRPVWQRSEKVVRPKVPRPVKVKAEKKQPIVEEKEPEEKLEPTAEEDVVKRQSRFERAKKKR
ncbi:MAG: VWA domain-containing protein [Verrucomicrobiales bacterium]|nr:VWA domain-containing protein [Verrucomicrobiales bacterium]